MAPLALVLALACTSDEGGSPYGSSYSSAADEIDEDTSAAESSSSEGTDSASTSESDASSSSESDASTSADPTTGGGGGTPCASDNDPKQLLACGDQIQQSYAGIFGDLDQACGEAYPYQDSIFHFIPPLGGATVTASYAVQGNDPGDGAILVLEGACSEGSCVASSLDELPRNDVTFTALDGVDYWFVFEAPSQQPTYAITIACE